MMNRRLILIFNDGGKTNHLKGVSIDKAALIEHFTSAEGGAWEKSEMKVFFDDCTKQKLEQHINFWRNAGNIDYWVIVFSGHGYATDTDTYLELSSGNDCGVKAIKQMLNYNKCLLIADSCRVLVNEAVENLAVRRERLFSSITDSSVYRKKCKDLYDKAWNFVYSGSFNAGFAASLGQAANDDDQKGGYYIEGIINAANSSVNSTRVFYGTSCSPDEIVPFSAIHNAASKHVMTKSYGSQQPTTMGSSLESIPFVVTPNA